MDIGSGRLCVPGRIVTLLHGPGCNLGMVGDGSGCALLGGFATSALVSLLWQHTLYNYVSL